MLVLDAGNALFKNALPGQDAQERARAELLLEQMEAQGTRAMAVGTRDLTLGPDFLVRAQKGRQMKLLSANLVDAAGKPLFAPSSVVSVGGVKFGLVGLSPEGPVPGHKGLTGRPGLKAVLAEARRLREKDKVDVVVVLAAVPYGQASALSLQAGDAVELILQSNDGRASTLAQREVSALLLTAGARGRQVGRAVLSVGGAGPFTDLAEAERTQQTLKIIDVNLQQARQSLAAAQDEVVRGNWRDTVASLEARKQELLARAAPSRPGNERTLLYSYTSLGSDVPDDPDIQKRVERIEPPGSASH